MHRRLVNEAKRDGWDAEGIQHFPNENTIYILVDNIHSGEDDILVVKYKSEYPFKRPTVFYKNADILVFYKNLSEIHNREINHDFRKLHGEDCMCCSSLLCGNNWNVHNHITDIKREFEKYCHIKKRSIERFWCRKITERYLIEHLPIFEYL